MKALLIAVLFFGVMGFILAQNQLPNCKPVYDLAGIPRVLNNNCSPVTPGALEPISGARIPGPQNLRMEIK